MDKIFLISKITFTELYKSKVMIGTVVLAIVMFLISFVSAEFSYGVPEKIALDVGLGLASLSGVGMAIFMGAVLLNREIENRTLYMVLSRPVGRKSFFLGRTLGLILMIVLNMGLLICLSYYLFYLFGGEFDQLFLYNLFGMLSEMILLLLCVVLLSLFLNPTLSVLASIWIYIIGHGLTPAQELLFVQERPWLLKLIKTLRVIFPDFSVLNFKNLLTYKISFDSLELFKIFTYFSSYSLFVIVLIVLIFEKKSLD